jgi:hypothetical protein
VKYDSNKHNRRSIRLRGYDYRRYGAYFVTTCTAQRACILEDEDVRDAILMTWRAAGKYARAATGDEFVVMPNHVHGIVWLRPRGLGPGDHAEPSRFRVSGERDIQLWSQALSEPSSVDLSPPLRNVSTPCATHAKRRFGSEATTSESSAMTGSWVAFVITSETTL